MRQSVIRWGMAGLVGGLMTLAGAPGAQAATVVQTHTENFTAGGGAIDDQTLANFNNETVKQITGSSNHWWGAFNGITAQVAGGLADNVAINTAPPTTADGGSLFFCEGAAVPGSRAYTRFDSTSVADPRNVPSIIVDLSLPGATATVTVSQVQNANKDFALLLRDGTNWYRSPTQTGVAGVTPASPATFVIDIHSVTWTQIGASGGATADMDQVDNGGETGPLSTTGGPVSPTFATVDGMGIEVLAGGGLNHLAFEKIVLQNGTASVNWTEHWERY